MLHTGPQSLFFFSSFELLLAPTSDEMPNGVKEQRVPKKKDTKFIHNRPNKHPASCSVISIHLHTTLLCPQMIRLCVFSLGSCGWMRVICNFVHTSLNAVADYLNSIFFFSASGWIFSLHFWPRAFLCILIMAVYIFPWLSAEKCPSEPFVARVIKSLGCGEKGAAALSHFSMRQLLCAVGGKKVNTQKEFPTKKAELNIDWPWIMRSTYQPIKYKWSKNLFMPN